MLKKYKQMLLVTFLAIITLAGCSISNQEAGNTSEAESNTEEAEEAGRSGVSSNIGDIAADDTAEVYKNREFDSDEQKVALTFDDGPDPEVTPQILNILNQYEARATFYMVGNSVEYYPEIAREVAEEGHEIGNHTMTHADLTTSPEEEAIYEIDKTNELIAEATGQIPTSFRPPYGSTTEALEELVNMPAVLWTVDSFDWQSREAESIIQAIQEEIHEDAIILMHDIHQETADALPEVLNYLKSEGYEMVTVSELLFDTTSELFILF